MRFEVTVGRTSENFTVASDISVGSAFVTLSNGEKMFFFDNYHEPSNLEIIYDHSDDPSGDIYYQRVGIDGFKIGTAQVVNISVHHTQDYPKTLQFEDGSFVVAWSQSIGGSTFAAVYQRFDSDGTKLGDENYLTTTDAPSDTISLVPAGGNGFEVEVGRTSENFSVDSDISVGSAFVTLSNGEKMFFFDNYHEPSNLEIIYDHSDDPSGDIYYQRVGIDGFKIGTAQVVNISVHHTQDYPKTLQFEDGSFVVAWSQSIGGSTFAAVYQRFDSDGTKLGDENYLTTTDAPSDTISLVPAGGNGFEVEVGRTSENFSVEDTANGNQTDTTPPAIEEVSTSWGSHINVTEDVFDGTVTVTTNGAEGGQTVTVALNAKNYTGSVSGDSAAITIPAADLQALTDGGTYSLTADVSDAAGNAAVQDSSISFDVDKTPPTLLAISATISSGITGITEAGAMVSVVMTDPAGAVNTFETAADATGEWNISAVELMGSEFTSDDNGTYAFFVSATDAAENAYVVPTVNLVVDVEAPAQDVIGGLNIEQLSKAGDVVTYGLIADASYDLAGDGIGALDIKTINFDPTEL